jgi:PKD repeat protein
VTLAVENACGADEAELVVAVCAPPAIAELTSDRPVAVGETVQFTATVTGSEPITYTWDFGGAGTGSDLETANPTWTYDDAGDYTVTLTVTNPCGSHTDTLPVRVEMHVVYLPLVAGGYTP